MITNVPLRLFRLDTRFNELLLFRFPLLNPIIIQTFCNPHSHLGIITEWTWITNFTILQLQKAFRANGRLATISHVDFFIMQEANWAFLIGRDGSGICSSESCRYLTVSDEASDLFSFPI